MKHELAGLYDDSDHEEVNGDEEEHKEAPLPINNKPFVVKKFRSSLQRGDCVTGMSYT